MLNHFSFQDFGGKILITNDFGCFAFLSHNDFDLLVHDKLPRETPVYQKLKSKYFVYDCHPEVFAEQSLDSIILNTLIDKIVIGERHLVNGRYEQEIKIYYKFGNVPADVYNGAGGLEINSMKLCNSIAPSIQITSRLTFFSSVRAETRIQFLDSHMFR